MFEISPHFFVKTQNKTKGVFPRAQILRKDKKLS